jgi:hypothetical protein
MKAYQVIVMKMRYEKADRLFGKNMFFYLVKAKAGVKDYKPFIRFYEDTGGVAGSGIVPAVSS